MNDMQKAGITAIVPTGMYGACVWLAVGPIVSDHMRYFISGPLFLPGGSVSVLTGCVILIAGVYLSFFVPSLVLWRAIFLRRSGQMLQRAHGEARRGMPGLEALKGSIE
jgi:hypothetical protein